MSDLENLLKEVKERDPNQEEFHQAVEEVVSTLGPLIEKKPKYLDVLRKMIEPERVIIFRVPWIDSEGKQQVNRGYRVQFNSAIGPYKGGLRFHPTVTLSVLKFLGFEQILKNSLTTLPMGGGKGGSDFNPRGKTDAEVNSFCMSFMSELFRHIGPNTDVPAGDIGVGGREIGFLYGQYKRLVNRSEGVLTGKGFEFGGSRIRPEATGFGAVYFLRHMLEANDMELKEKRVMVSGSGNVAQYCVKKLLENDAVPISMSDSDGTLFFKDGITEEAWEKICELKNEKRGRLSELDLEGAEYKEDAKPWTLDTEADIAIPCATQNEVSESDAEALVKAGVKAVAEGANMPSEPEAVEVYKKNKFLFGPAKAVNAGGVATSGLEMSQNSLRLQWSREEVNERLEKIMKDIFDACADAAKEYASEPTDYATGANIAGFIKVADAMLAQGAV